MRAKHVVNIKYRQENLRSFDFSRLTVRRDQLIKIEKTVILNKIFQPKHLSIFRYALEIGLHYTENARSISTGRLFLQTLDKYQYLKIQKTGNKSHEKFFTY